MITTLLVADAGLFVGAGLTAAKNRAPRHLIGACYAGSLVAMTLAVLTFQAVS